jgi:hypothetical protein
MITTKIDRPHADANLIAVTGCQAGLNGRDQIMIALAEIDSQGGFAQTAQIYEAVDAEMSRAGFSLSCYGKASLRCFINREAVADGYIVKDPPGWSLTMAGRQALSVSGARCASDVVMPAAVTDNCAA